MSAIAERIEERLRTLPRARAAQLEQQLLRVLDSADTATHPAPPPYRTRPLLHGLRPGYSYDKVEELLQDTDEMHKRQLDHAAFCEPQRGSPMNSHG